MILIASPEFGAHVTPPGHPERVERAEVFDRVARRWASRVGPAVALRRATRDELLRVHDRTHVERMFATSGLSLMLDEDTFTSPETHDVALLAAGAAIQAVDAAMAGTHALAMVRPPGHHAERDRPMGFCFYNNVAVAAAHALASGRQRVAIVDIDVHHGNGTQWMFYDDPRVLYVSSHQFPFYPGTGAADEIGRGDGRGFTVNIPLEAGCRDADYALALSSIVRPVLTSFAPDVCIVSAGFDAHERDPLASMRVTTAGYAAMLAFLAGTVGVPLAVVTEGGYDLVALEECLDAAVRVLNEGAAAAAEDSAQATRGSRLQAEEEESDALTAGGFRLQAEEDASRGARGVEAARRALAPYWPAL